MNAPQSKPTVAAPPVGPAPGNRAPAYVRTALFLVLCALGAYWFIAYHLPGRAYEKTDNAFIEARVVYISARIPGQLERLHVTDNQRVSAGELLAEIDRRDYEIEVGRARAVLDAAIAKQRAAEANLEMTRVTSAATLDEARDHLAAVRARELEETARIEAARAEMERAQADYRRLRDMAENLVSPQEIDSRQAAARSAAAAYDAARKRVTATQAEIQQAEARLRSADTAALQVALMEAELQQRTAEVAQARAALERAELNLSWARIAAPEDGRIAKRFTEEGAWVQPGSSMLTLTTDDLWVVANFKETQLTRMRPGQPVELRVDAYPGEVFQGRVDSIQPGTGARFSLLPPENATGNYVKVVQRVPVKIVFDPPPPDPSRLVPGMSVVPRVKTE